MWVQGGMGTSFPSKEPHWLSLLEQVHANHNPISHFFLNLLDNVVRLTIELPYTKDLWVGSGDGWQGKCQQKIVTMQR